MLATVKSCSTTASDAFIIDVEADVSKGLPVFDLVGLPQLAVKESKNRVRAALKNAGAEFPTQRITVNLAPADREKESAMLDLPILLAVAVAAKIIPAFSEKTVFCGEVSLSGEIRPIRGAVAVTAAAMRAGMSKVVLPLANAAEASIISGIDIYGVSNVKEIIEMQKGGAELRKFLPDRADEGDCYDGLPDFAEVKGHLYAKRAIEIAVSGGHNIAMIGPAGSGKSMLAKCIPSILPPLSKEQSIEATKIHSIAGTLNGRLIRTAPFRAPHHTVSAAGLAGGGAKPHPGEISLAHNGVLFLDELPEFSRAALEIMRQPLEDKKLTVSRATYTETFPADFMLVCAMNPCRCGNYGGPKPCKCSLRERESYLAHISGPLWDRIDMKIDVPVVSLAEMQDVECGENSAAIRQRVLAAREIQKVRFAESDKHLNAQMTHADVERFCKMTSEGRELISRYFESERISGRAYDRLLKVARTIADINGEELIGINEIAEAISYKTKVI